ncbi:hypothetical protein CEUSTIGMA_g4467.t1 [Chlamydomonas eustigma]|uniref:6-phosphofructo-2-kinase domain-containing protein n=1 Tax=Chlamydomonas eustigma TaxID=1157962 RepID=A0A250X2P0_9CHLO|nr:hypothetical protein CEUSTIGMA_g4467.t1 [Chlamydomonas eustigma]|eukprot:GAX77020.1 hypothetical protein CEUSTIGMA_g4467.t1 [Chlamydomonas eustigma]
MSSSIAASAGRCTVTTYLWPCEVTRSSSWVQMSWEPLQSVGAPKKEFVSQHSYQDGSLAKRSANDKIKRPSNIQTHVNFKDLNLSVDEDVEHIHDHDSQIEVEEESGRAAASGGPNSPLHVVRQLRRVGRTKQVLIMVGLPGRGKTFLCNKLKCYLNWLGHSTKHINVGSYRRMQKPEGQLQSADFFDSHNQEGIKQRNKALEAALADVDDYLDSDEGQVVIFDATNTTEERRQKLISHFHGRYQYLFIESICNDPVVLEQNYLFKMKYSPDYKGVDKEEAVRDFKERVRKYEEVYEPLSNRNVHYIKLIDMVTGRGYMDVNRISGYIPGKIVFFLMQVCKAGMAQARKIWMTRHGESEFNVAGIIGGDSSLSLRGEEYARQLPHLIMDRLPLTADDETIPISVWTSTLKRTIQTASLLPFPKLRWKALDEIHAGSCDGLTYQEIEARYPDEYAARGEDKLRYRYPAGESYQDVIQRLEPAIIELERERECVCIVGHQAILRAIMGYFTNTPLELIPNLPVPLHTLIELRPMPDGTMEVETLPLNIGTALPYNVSAAQLQEEQPLKDSNSTDSETVNLSRIPSARSTHLAALMSANEGNSHTDSASGHLSPGTNSGAQPLQALLPLQPPYVLHRKFPSNGNSNSFFYASSTGHNSNASIRGGSEAGDALLGFDAGGPEAVEVVDFGRRLSASGGRKSASNLSTSPDPAMGVDSLLWQQAAATAASGSALGDHAEMTPTRQSQGRKPTILSAPATFERRSHGASVAMTTEFSSPDATAALSPRFTPTSAGQAGGSAHAGMQARLAATGLPPRSPVGSPPVSFGVMGNPQAPWNNNEQGQKHEDAP